MSNIMNVVETMNIIEKARDNMNIINIDFGSEIHEGNSMTS